MAGRKPLSTALKEAKGSFKTNPGRRNQSEPQPKKARPRKPKTIKGDTVAEQWWKHTCDVLEGFDMLTVADAHIIEGYCLNESWMRRASEVVKETGLTIQSGQAIKSNPAAAEWNKAMDRRLKFQAELGLTASARTRLSAIPKDKEDPISNFINNLGAKNS